MLFKWFDASEAKQFGESLANFYIQQLPLVANNKKKRPEPQNVLHKMLQQISRFKLEHKLNIYKKAQLGNAFKWKLKDAGYDAEFIDAVTKELMISL